MRSLLAIVAFVFGAVAWLTCAYEWFKIVDDVNDKVEPGERLSYFTKWPTDMGKAMGLHQRIYPTSSRVRLYQLSFLAAVVFGALWTWASGFLNR